MLIKKKIQGQKGHEYFATESCKELLPIFLALGDWGMRWARSNLTTKDYDVELLMLYLQRSIEPEKLPDTETIVQFTFSDMPEKSNWWLVVNDGAVDTCDKNPGKDVDVYFSTTVQAMADIAKSGESGSKRIANAYERDLRIAEASVGRLQKRAEALKVLGGSLVQRRIAESTGLASGQLGNTKSAEASMRSFIAAQDELARSRARLMEGFTCTQGQRCRWLRPRLIVVCWCVFPC